MHKPLTIVITGASAGVGRATAMAFARKGARIGLIARQADALAATAEEVNRAGGTGLPLPLDLADADAVRAAADRAEDELGPLISGSTPRCSPSSRRSGSSAHRRSGG